MDIIFWLAILIFSVVIHEVSHGAMANHLGDPTAKYAGRLTLNPLKHLDFLGSFIVPMVLILMSKMMGGGIIFGWAKPVPFNPYNLRDQRWGIAKVAAAGPLANLAVALVFGLSLRFMPESVLAPGLFEIFSLIVILNLLLAIFNLIPIPPLDGSKIFFTLLPHSLEDVRIFLERYGLMLLLLFIFFAFQWIIPLIFWLYFLLVGKGLSF